MDVAYIGYNSKTKRPRKTKLCTGVPLVTCECDSHTDFKVKRSKVKVRRGHIVPCGGDLAAQLVFSSIHVCVCVHVCSLVDTITLEPFEIAL